MCLRGSWIFPHHYNNNLLTSISILVLNSYLLSNLNYFIHPYVIENNNLHKYGEGQEEVVFRSLGYLRYLYLGSKVTRNEGEPGNEAKEVDECNITRGMLSIFGERERPNRY